MRLDPADRYQSADEMLIDIEHVLRSVFRPVGQTELKRWLADLQRRDGVASIGKAAAGSTPTRTGSGELEGKDVVLSEPADDLEVGAEDNTSLAVLGQPEGMTRPRPSRHRASATELPLPIPDDDETAMGTQRHSESELAASIADEADGPPVRRQTRRFGRGLTVLVTGALLIVGAAIAGSYLGSRAEEKRGSRAAGDLPPPVVAPPPVAAGAAVTAKKEPREAREAKEPPKEGTTAAPIAATAKEKEGEPARPAPPPGPAPRKLRGSGAERGEYRSRGIIELKNMMQPDPSQLPPTPAPPPPAPPAPPKPAEAEAPAPPAPAAPSSETP
jgi:hypothetical protein